MSIPSEFSFNNLFNDLGLLVIDEEQRFGVKQKEKIKEYRETIDVLSLSATPIPRTLQMSLMGIRGLSKIDTPPKSLNATSFDKIRCVPINKSILPS